MSAAKWTQEMIDECEREAEEMLAVFGEFVNARIVADPDDAEIEAEKSKASK